MGNPGTAVRGLATLTAALLMSGCVPSISGSGGSETPPPPPAGSGQLSQEQVDAAMPTDDQLPQGFSVDPEGMAEDTSGNDPESTAYPATCLDVRLAGTTGKELKTHLVTRQKKSFIGDNGGSLTVTVSTHDEQVPGKLFDDAGAAQSQCGTFQLIDSSGTSSWKLAQVTFPQLGERTYATRVESTTEGDIFKGGVIQLAGVSVGNNLVYVVYSSGPASEYDPTAVETFAKATVDNLNAL